MSLKRFIIGIAAVLATGMAARGNAAEQAEAAPKGVLRDAGQEVRGEISRILADQDRAWAEGDAEGYTARALPEIVFTNVVGAYSVGKAPLLAQVRHIFTTIYKGSTAKTTLVGIAMVGDDVAIVDTISKLTNFQKPAMASVVVDGATYSRLQETMVKRNGGWWIGSIHNVLIIPDLVPRGEAAK